MTYPMNMKYREMNDYDCWANNAILEIHLKHPEVVEVANLFHHILEANKVWHSRLTNVPVAANVWAEDYKIDEFQNRIQLNYERINEFLRSKDIGDLEAIIHYENLAGDPFSSKISDILYHVFNHSTHHRAQIMILWKEWNIERPKLDYIVYKRIQSN